MKCSDCVYYYAEENDLFTTCHFTPRGSDDIAPCEAEDDPTIDEYIDEDW
jgi:hypothetical protein